MVVNSQVSGHCLAIRNTLASPQKINARKTAAQGGRLM
jgi:hypothetical protein